MAWQRLALTYYSYGYSNRHRTRGQIRGQQNLGPFPLAELTRWIYCCWPRSTQSDVLTGWLSALGKGSSNVSIYREESMIMLARNRKGLGRERKGKGFWQYNCSLLGRCRVKAFLSSISVFNACFSDQWKERSKHF